MLKNQTLPGTDDVESDVSFVW